MMNVFIAEIFSARASISHHSRINCASIAHNFRLKLSTRYFLFFICVEHENAQAAKYGQLLSP
jgi:hypothetical protein